MTCSLIQNDSCKKTTRPEAAGSYSGGVPVVEVVKKEVELAAGSKTLGSRNEVVVG